jgi:hypothetical protein
MIINHVHISKNVYLSLTADDWQLYHIKYRDDAALRLNQAISNALNNFTKGGAITQIEKALEENNQWGANDTEGHATVRQILDLFYK